MIGVYPVSPLAGGLPKDAKLAQHRHRPDDGRFTNAHQFDRPRQIEDGVPRQVSLLTVRLQETPAAIANGCHGYDFRLDSHTIGADVGTPM